jgi:3-phenylpropionate/cinnamic acid dioxygenase small subunit
MPVNQREDTQDIAEVLVAYATSIDRRDWTTFRTCFTEDCDIEYEGAGAWIDVEQLTHFMIDAHATMGHTLHRLSSIDVSADGDRARARSYIDAVLMAADGRTGINSIGWYDDQLVRTTDGWRIVRRRYTMVRMVALGSDDDLSGR